MIHHTAYEDYKSMLSEQVEKSIKKIDFMQQKKTLSDDSSLIKELNNCLDDELDITITNDDIVRPPRNVANAHGIPDYALVMYRYAKMQSINPVVLATKVAQMLESCPALSWVEATGPYVNIRVTDSNLIAKTKNILQAGDSYGQLSDNTGKTAIIEYSSPNVAKPFGINHLRSTVIGEALARILEASGYTVIRDNHLGDWGTQFGNLLAAHQEYKPERDFSSFTMDELTELYVRFSKEKKESPRLVKLGQACFSLLEAGDPDMLVKWSVALTRSIKEFSLMYERLNVHFDTMLGEAYFVDASNKLIDELAHLAPADLVTFDQQTKAVYINAEHPVVIRTQDGYGVYAARDLATIQFRQQTYKPNVVLYVVGDEQSSYFRSIFEVARKAMLLNPLDNTELEHVSFGLLLDKDGKKLSTRKGTGGKLDAVIQALDERAVEETVKRNPTMESNQINEIAHKITVGALIWNDLRTDRTSSIRFDIERMLELGGGSVIDILYTYSRTCSILDRVTEKSDMTLSNLPEAFSSETEHTLALRLSEFESIVRDSVSARAPHVIVSYLQEVAELHGRFYEQSRVVGLDDEQIASLRIALHRAYKILIENGLKLLNIPVSHRL